MALETKEGSKADKNQVLSWQDLSTKCRPCCYSLPAPPLLELNLNLRSPTHYDVIRLDSKQPHSAWPITADNQKIIVQYSTRYLETAFSIPPPNREPEQSGKENCRLLSRDVGAAGCEASRAEINTSCLLWSVRGPEVGGRKAIQYIGWGLRPTDPPGKETASEWLYWREKMQGIRRGECGRTGPRGRAVDNVNVAKNLLLLYTERRNLQGE